MGSQVSHTRAFRAREAHERYIDRMKMDDLVLLSSTSHELRDIPPNAEETSVFQCRKHIDLGSELPDLPVKRAIRFVVEKEVVHLKVFIRKMKLVIIDKSPYPPYGPFPNYLEY